MQYASTFGKKALITALSLTLSLPALAKDKTITDDAGKVLWTKQYNTIANDLAERRQQFGFSGISFTGLTAEKEKKSAFIDALLKPMGVRFVSLNGDLGVEPFYYGLLLSSTLTDVENLFSSMNAEKIELAKKAKKGTVAKMLLSMIANQGPERQKQIDKESLRYEKISERFRETEDALIEAKQAGAPIKTIKKLEMELEALDEQVLLHQSTLRRLITTRSHAGPISYLMSNEYHSMVGKSGFNNAESLKLAILIAQHASPSLVKEDLSHQNGYGVESAKHRYERIVTATLKAKPELKVHLTLDSEIKMVQQANRKTMINITSELTGLSVKKINEILAF